ncbi:hypothetical protein [Aurantivibrio infirmus]
MENISVYIICALLVSILWFVPAAILTIRVKKHEGIEPIIKKQLILSMWVIPIVGTLVCFLVFAKIGRVPRLSEADNRDIWLSKE